MIDLGQAVAPLLSVRDLSVRFRTRSGPVHALERVCFDVAPGEILGVVGESGSGKSVLSLALMGLLEPSAEVYEGTATFAGEGATSTDLLARRGRARPRLAMVFQSPRTALNPIRRVGRQLIDVITTHEPGLARPRERARELMQQVRIPDPERRLEAYPFELSGGMCQRVMIALALAARPRLLIADEPTTGLDVTTQAAIVDLLRDLSRAHGMSTMLITHDLGLAAECCDRILVMHAGHVVEHGTTEALLTRPRHPYTARLIAATPHASARLEDLAAIPGQLPDLRRTPLPACRYHGRCERAEPGCTATPAIRLAAIACSIDPAHQVACRSPLP